MLRTHLASRCWSGLGSSNIPKTDEDFPLVRIRRIIICLLVIFVTINQLPRVDLTAGDVDGDHEGGKETQDDIIVIKD